MNDVQWVIVLRGDLDDVAAALKQMGRSPEYPIYHPDDFAVTLAGYFDPDEGVPSIHRVRDGERAPIWMADFELPGCVPGPESVPTDDPFAFVAAFGVDLSAR